MDLPQTKQDELLDNPQVQEMIEKLAQSEEPMKLFEQPWNRLCDYMELLPRRLEGSSREEIARTLKAIHDEAMILRSMCAMFLRRFDPQSDKAFPRGSKREANQEKPVE